MTKPVYRKNLDKCITADGRDLTHEEWRTIKEFPNYEITKDGDVRNRDTRTILTDRINSKNGSTFYALHKNGKLYSRNYKGLLYKTYPEALDEWKSIPKFPGYLIHPDGRVMSKHFYKELPRDEAGAYRLRRNGRRHSFYSEKFDWTVHEEGSVEWFGGEGWYEFFKHPGATTHIAHLSESGSVYTPEGGIEYEDFLKASKDGRAYRLIREDAV